MGVGGSAIGSAIRIRDGAGSVSNLTNHCRLAVWMCPFCAIGEPGLVADVEAGKAVLRDTFGGWIERLKGKRHNRGSHSCLPGYDISLSS